MATRGYTDLEQIYINEPDGGEATPRPLKARKLLDMMEGQGRSPNRKPSRKDTPPKEHPHRETAEKSPKSKPSPQLRRVSVPDSQPLPTVCTVLSVTPSGEGETVAVVMALQNHAGGKPQRVSFHLLVEQYAELGVKVGEVTPEAAEVILDGGRLCGAIRRGMAMLGYGDHSARRLASKLMGKGVDREIASRAVAYLVERGYIREESTATLRARQGVSKGWGERRIEEDLFAHGFTREAVEEAMTQLSDVDWEENCASAIRKKYREIPAERRELQKLMAAMMRLGYDADTVKAALRRIMREE